MPKRTRDYRVGLLKELASPESAAHYLNAAPEDSDEMLLIALRDVAEAHRVSRLAEEAEISREHVYRMLSKHGNPRYSSLVGILRALGLRLVVEPGPGNPTPAIPPGSPHTK
jgi:probable addiction module antidote protein